MNKKIIICFCIILVIFMLCSVVDGDMVNKIIAVVNDEVITKQDLDKFFLPLKLQIQAEYKGENLKKKLKIMRNNLLKEIINDKILLKEARDDNLTVSEDKVEAKLNNIRNRFSSEKVFQDMLKKSGMNISDLKKRYEEQLLIDKLISIKIKSKVRIIPKEIKEYYEKNKTEFKTGEGIKVRQILIYKESKDALDRIKMIKNLLNEKAEFSYVASKFSEGPNAKKGGLLGVIEKGNLIPEIDKIVFNLKEGEISDIVFTSIGYHIFSVDEKLVESFRSFSSVRSRIRNILFEQKANQKFKEYLEELYKKTYVSIKQ